ncbi:MAG: hypothetical protein A2W27_06190 [Deltaproteobacteria bacterium RBG_16_44_11]|nr:MAG: hypothetical protein A2W27_06190 [Deltaproteobacteria bacterium RBG_16_44_11]
MTGRKAGGGKGVGIDPAPFPLVRQIDTTDTVQELIDKTRQAIMANFNPEYSGRAEKTGLCP